MSRTFTNVWTAIKMYPMLLLRFLTNKKRQPVFMPPMWCRLAHRDLRKLCVPTRVHIWLRELGWTGSLDFLELCLPSCNIWGWVGLFGSLFYTHILIPRWMKNKQVVFWKNFFLNKKSDHIFTVIKTNWRLPSHWLVSCSSPWAGNFY